MCRTLLTVIHHACQPGHLTRHTRTEQCYTAHLLGARVCAPGPPRHSFYEQHLPGSACQSCVSPHRAYNTDAEDEANDDDDDDDIDMDPAALHNQRLLFRQNAPYHPAAYVPRPLSLLPAPVNPPYLGTGQHTHEQIPYSGPSVPMGVRGPHGNRPPVAPFAQPHELSQGDEYPSGNYPGDHPRDVSPIAGYSSDYPSDYPSGDPGGDAYDEAANDPREPAQVQTQQQRPRTPQARDPLVPIMEDEREDHSDDDNTYETGSEDFVHIERPSQFGRDPSPPWQSPPPIPRRRRPHLSHLPLPRRSPSASPPVSSGYSPMTGNLRGGAGDGDGDSASGSDSSRTLAPPSGEVEEEDDGEEERQLREALERSARERDDREDDDLRRVAAESLRDYADVEHAALVQAMHDSAAEAEEYRKRVEKEEEREVLRRSVRTWREEVAMRMGEQQGSNERGGSGREDEDGVGMFRGFADLDDLWTKRAGIDGNVEKGEGSTAPRREDQNPPHPTRPSPKLARRVCPPPPPTVEDEPERPTWSFEGVADQLQVQDDEPATRGPADEVTRAMEAVDLSTDPAEYIRTKRLERFTGNNDE